MGTIQRDLAGVRVLISTHGYAEWTDPRDGAHRADLAPLIAPANDLMFNEYTFHKLEHPANLAKIAGHIYRLLNKR